MFGSIESIVRESGRRVRSATGFTIADKGTKENIVTSADIENERFLKRELTSLIPGSSFMGEEGDESPLLERGYTWIVDPIDGTANFSRGIPMSAVSVALFKDAEPYIGFVHNPFTGTLWKAEAGKGAFKDDVPIHVSNRPMADGLMCTAWCAYDKSMAPACFKVSERMHPLCNDIRRIGTAACELAMLAEGAVDLYFEIRLSPWDHAAALTCVKEAGGFFGGIDGPVDFSRPSPVIAANSMESFASLHKIVSEEFGGKAPYR